MIFIGDASMSPYEISHPGGSVEHINAEAGYVWMQRLKTEFDNVVWLNPVEEHYWHYTHSIEMTQQLVEDKMYPLTLDGMERAIKALTH